MKIHNPYLAAYNKVNVFNNPLIANGLMKEMTIRNHLLVEYGYAIPDDEVASTIKKYSPIVELGAGNGYWGYVLSQYGINIKCFDNFSWENNKESRFESWRENKLYPVEVGNEEIVKKHKDRSLMMIWPYMNKMAYNALRMYEGDTLIYVGESYGGCTADDNFFKELSLNWKLVDGCALNTWSWLHDHLSVYRRD